MIALPTRCAHDEGRIRKECRKSLRPILSAFLATVALACADTGASPDGTAIASDSAGVRIIEASAPAATSDAPFRVDSAPVLVIGAEDGEEAYELFRVSDALRLPDGRIVVANTGTSDLRVFDSTGRFLTRVGRPGAGPGEFGSFLIRLHFVGGELLASDSERARLHAYDSALALIETRSFTLTPDIPRPILQGVFADGSWLAIAFDSGGALRGPPGSVITTRFALTHFDAGGQFLTRFGSFSGRQRYVNAVGISTHYPHLPFTVDAAVRAYGDQVLIVRGDRPEIEIWSTEGTLHSLLRWPRESVRAVELYPRFREQALAGLATADERTRRLYGAFYAKDLPIPEYAPLYEDVIVDSSQRVWLLRYRLPGELDTHQWDVIEKSGRWLGTVSTPPNLQVFRIDESSILGRTRDSLGVERVILHRLSAAP